MSFEIFEKWYDENLADLKNEFIDNNWQEFTDFCGNAYANYLDEIKNSKEGDLKRNI